MVRALVFCVAALWAGAAFAADQPVYTPIPAWVKPAVIPVAVGNADGAPVQVLLVNSQARYTAAGDEFFQEYAAKILAPQGLAVGGAIAQNWNPDTDTLYIHRLNIIRDGKVIDVLASGQKFIVLRRENQLELAMLDGTLTATIQPEGLEVGDIIDVAMTLLKQDPVLQGRAESLAAMRFPGVVGHVLIRQVWPNDKSIRWRITEGLDAPVVTHTATGSELTIEMNNERAPKPPMGAPTRFNNLSELEMTQFADWAEVSSLMAPLYVKASQLAPNSPVRAEIAKIAASTTDPKLRAAAALHLVQERTRYVFLGMNFGGYIPAPADQTWARRFGDCKGKTALLLAILHELGIEAQPALVSTTQGDGMDERLPSLLPFDHVMVRAAIGGKVYWLQGTREGDRGLDDITIPNFHWALPVQANGAKLEKLEPKQLTVPETEGLLSLDASGGLDVPAPAHQDVFFRGDTGIAMNLRLNSVTHEDADRFLREFWNRTLPWVTVSKVGFAYDQATGVMRISMDGSATMAWSRNGPVRDFDIAQSAVGSPNASYKREPGPHIDAPFAVGYPNFNLTRVTIALPDKGAGYILRGGTDIDRVVGATELHRHSHIEGGLVTMEIVTKSLATEFPASEADADAAALREMSRADVVVRAPPVLSAGAVPVPPGAVGGVPTTAAGFAARGALALRRADYDYAFADFDRATRMEPANAHWVYDRAVAHLARGENDLALADFSQAVVLSPTDPVVLMARGELYLRKGDAAHADQDFDAAAKLAPNDQSYALRRANADERAGRLDAAIGVLDTYAAGHPTGTLLYSLDNARCWMRATHNVKLDLALADCNAALTLKPDYAAALDSRGFVELRMGRLAASIADYTAALALMPKSAETLYGRGLAETRKGDQAAAQADIAAAVAIDPKVVAEFGGYGLTK